MVVNNAQPRIRSRITSIAWRDDALTLTFYDFFAGAGLVTLALQEDWTCVWANDIDPRKAEVYEANFGLNNFCLGDVAETTSDSLPPGADLAWASFPCQDLSLAGWRQGMTACRSGVFWEFWRVMHELLEMSDRPPLIVLENVPGLLYGDGFSGLCEALAALGLQFGALVIDGVHFVPQSRPRVFVVAVDSRLNCDEFTELWLNSSPWFPASLMRAWADLPPSLRKQWRWWRVPFPEGLPRTPVFEIIQDDENVEWDSQEGTAKLISLMSRRNREKLEKAVASGHDTVGFLYKRTRNGRQRAEVRFDGIAGCLRTPSGGSSRQVVVLVKNGQVKSRLLLPREAARLMGAPDSFWLPPHYNNAYLAMGDAVVVPAVQWLSKHLLVPIARKCRQTSLDLRSITRSTTELESARANARELAETWKMGNASEKASL
jgi:DNA (cytosine-5)-methyltransferase 1